MKKSSRVSEIHLIEFLEKIERSNEEIKERKAPPKGTSKTLNFYLRCTAYSIIVPNCLTYIIRKYVSGNLTLGIFCIKNLF